MIKHRIILAVLALVLGAGSSLAAQSDPVACWFPDRTWYPGDPVICYIRVAPGTEKLNFTVASPKNRKLVFKAFPSGKYEGLWVAIAAINSRAVAETFSYTLNGSTKEGKYWSLEGSFDVKAKDFKSYSIKFDSKASTLMTKPDPRKTEQYERMRKVLTTFDTSLPVVEGKAVPPLENLRLTSGYGDRREYLYTNGTKSTTEHTGLDWGAPKGTPVRAGIRGTVVVSEERILSGNSVVICPAPGVFVIYYHMNSLECKVGQVVEPDTLIGTVGMTGFVTGPHLHYEVQIQGFYTSPQVLLDQGFIDTDAAALVLLPIR